MHGWGEIATYGKCQNPKIGGIWWIPPNLVKFLEFYQNSGNFGKFPYFSEKVIFEWKWAKKPIKRHWFRKHSQHAAKKGPGIAKFLKFLENLKISQNSWNFVKFTKIRKIPDFCVFRWLLGPISGYHVGPPFGVNTFIVPDPRWRVFQSQIRGDGAISG